MARKSKRALEEWIADKPTVLAVLCVAVAGAADEIAEHMIEVRRGESPSRDLPRGTVDQWMRLYSVTELRSRLSWLCGDRAAWKWLEELQAECRAWDALGEDERRERIALLTEEDRRQAQQFWRELIGWAVGMASGESPEDDTLDPEPEERVALRFFMTVHVPCLVEYQAEPESMLDRIRQGDRDAMVDLLKLDKTILADPAVLEGVREAADAKRGNRLERIGKAIGKRSQGRMSRRRVKALLGALMIEYSLRIQHPLNEPAVRALFDATAKRNGMSRDTDLPSPDTFYRAMKRFRPSVAELLPVGQ